MKKACDPTLEPENEISVKSYFASRVEVVSQGSLDVASYDVNSSFPSAKEESNGD